MPNRCELPLKQETGSGNFQEASLPETSGVTEPSSSCRFGVCPVLFNAVRPQRPSQPRLQWPRPRFSKCPIQPPSTAKCSQTEPSHITSLTGPCQLPARGFWVKFNFLAHLVKRALPTCSQLNLPPPHQPQRIQHRTQTASWVLWGVSNYCATPLFLPGEHPDGRIHLSSSTHLHAFLRVFPVLIPSSQKLGKNDQKLAMPAPIPGYPLQ